MLDKQRKIIYLRTKIHSVNPEGVLVFESFCPAWGHQSVEEDSSRAALGPSDFAEKNGSTRKLRQIQERNQTC